MKSEKLYDGVTGIREEIVERADAHIFRKKTKRMTWQKWTALAACFCLVVGGVYGAARLGLLGGAEVSAPGAGGGGNTGVAYMSYASYAGPVFPLTALGGAEGLTATRNIDFDFSPYASRTESYESDGETHSYETYDTESLVTDSYTLTNTTGEDMTVTAAYPFAGSFNDAINALPRLEADGVTVDAELHAGPYSGGFSGTGGEDDVNGSANLDAIDSWEGYKALIEGGYMASAFDEWPKLDRPVFVYEISDMEADETGDAANPTLCVSVEYDEENTVILPFSSGRFSGGGSQDGKRYFSFGVSRPEQHGYGESCYLILIGNDLHSYSLQGYRSGGCEPGDETDRVTGAVTRYEMTLDEAMDTLLPVFKRRYEQSYGSEGATVFDVLSDEQFLGCVKELLCDHGALAGQPKERYGVFFEDMSLLFYETRVMQRVMYLTFEITIPAGGSVDVTATMVKDASIDFIGPNSDRNGYDMVTRLGSDLSFMAQTASISNTEHVEMIDQNFGFDLANGVTAVELDASVEHYWLEVRKLK